MVRIEDPNVNMCLTLNFKNLGFKWDGIHYRSKLISMPELNAKKKWIKSFKLIQKGCISHSLDMSMKVKR